jgi:hypothetical protein
VLSCSHLDRVRTELGGDVYTYGADGEFRLAWQKKNGADWASWSYDADGKLAKFRGRCRTDPLHKGRSTERSEILACAIRAGGHPRQSFMEFVSEQLKTSYMGTNPNPSNLEVLLDIPRRAGMFMKCIGTCEDSVAIKNGCRQNSSPGFLEPFPGNDQPSAFVGLGCALQSDVDLSCFMKSNFGWAEDLAGNPAACRPGGDAHVIPPLKRLTGRPPAFWNTLTHDPMAGTFPDSTTPVCEESGK